DAHIKSRIINQNKNIRFKAQNILPAEGYISKDSRQMGDNFHKTHKSQFPNMLYQLSSCSFHSVAPPATDFGIGVLCFYSFNEIASVQISACFTSYYVKTHAQ